MRTEGRNQTKREMLQLRRGSFRAEEPCPERRRASHSVVSTNSHGALLSLGQLRQSNTVQVHHEMKGQKKRSPLYRFWGTFNTTGRIHRITQSFTKWSLSLSRYSVSRLRACCGIDRMLESKRASVQQQTPPGVGSVYNMVPLLVLHFEAKLFNMNIHSKQQWRLG